MFEKRNFTVFNLMRSYNVRFYGEVDKLQGQEYDVSEIT